MTEKTIDYYLRATWLALSKTYNEEAAKQGSTMSVGFVLLSVDKEGTPSTALGPKMGIEPTSLTRILKSMEEKGLIVRKKNPHDGRGVLVYLTAYGKEKRDVAREGVILFDKAIKANISKTKLNTFMEVIIKINELIVEKKIYNQE
jgi:DNA-binding MarR family transcriptional regulator